MARAMLLPIEVLPTPGGPTKHSMGLDADSLSFLTARNSRILSLTSFRS